MYLTIPFPGPLDKLFITCGQDTFQTSDTEVIDLSGNNLSCSKPPDYPRATYGQSSLKTPSGNPLACGGEYMTTECWEYRPMEDTWVRGPDLNLGRKHTPAVRISGGDYWLPGSYYSNAVDTSEIYVSTNNSFVFGPQLPDDSLNQFPCAVRITDDLSFVANERAFIYDWTADTLTETPTAMPFESREAQCGYAERSNGQPETPAGATKAKREQGEYRGGQTVDDVVEYGI